MRIGWLDDTGRVWKRAPSPGTASPKTMKSTIIALLTLAVALLIGSGCARVEKEKKTEGLEAATNAYGKSLRWAYYETAYGYLHPSLRTGLSEHLDNIRVTAYEVVQPPVMKDEGRSRAEQVVQIEYVRRDEQVVRKVSHRQDWRFDPASETWWLHSPMPAFD
jgi:hypothetical protein